MMLKALFLVLAGIFLNNCQGAVIKRGVEALSGKNAGWTYDDPNGWESVSPECGGEHQSPVGIDSTKAIRSSQMPAITFDNYDIIFRQTITNNGHTVMIQLQNNDQDDALPSISGGELNGEYIFHQLHFHWGHDDTRGSEHVIDNVRYEAELHIVHYNSKYSSFDEASGYPDGLAVLAVMIEPSKWDHIAFRHIEHFEQIIHPDGHPVSPLSRPISLDDLLPDETDSFYRYIGSLTTPSCNEAVIWTVFDTPISLSQRQMNLFRTLYDEEGRPLEDNYRPVQAINDRTIKYRPNLTA